MPFEIRSLTRDDLASFLRPICVAFGLPLPVQPERIERVRALTELDVLLGAVDGGEVVGSAGSFTFDMTLPGGVAIETAGLTMVAVQPTHRRRGILRDLMRRHLDGAHARGQAVAALWASEAPIYGRFGYGMASLCGDVTLPRERTAFVDPRPAPGRVRLLSEADAAAVFPAIWERARLARPGMLTRSEGWWRARRTADPDWLRAGRPSLNRVLLEIDGRPAAYALYRYSAPFGSRAEMVLDVVEALGDSPEATRAMWRWLLDVDLVTGFSASLLPVDHPLFFLLSEPRRLAMRLADALWVRLVDVGAALSRRLAGGAIPGGTPAPSGEPLVIDVEDAFCPWNQGRYRIAGGVVERTTAGADLALDAGTLGAAYLGGFGLLQLAQGGRVVEQTPGALRRADALLRGDLAPWCPEIF